MNLTCRPSVSVSSLWLSLAFLLSCVFFVSVHSGEVCRRKGVNGNDDVFECPRLFESQKKRFCCGQTPSEKYCCAWSKKTRDIIANPEDAKFLLEGAVAIIIMVLLVIGGLIICCCVCACCLLQRKQKRRGRVLNPSRTEATSVTTMTSPPHSVSYPVQPNAYPMHTMTTPYPMAEQPPPYSLEQPPYNPSYPTK